MPPSRFRLDKGVITAAAIFDYVCKEGIDYAGYLVQGSESEVCKDERERIERARA